MARTKGTQTVMTEEVIVAILKTIKHGLHPDRAADAQGVCPATMRSHKARDPNFATRIKEAESHAERGFLGRIIGHTEKQWTAAAWILERRWPDRWAKREPTMVEAIVGGEVIHRHKIDVEQLTKEQHSALRLLLGDRSQPKIAKKITVIE